jgi:hypothetical protein
MKAKLLRKYVKQAMATDMESAWNYMRACPLKARLCLAWRLARGRGMDGKRVAP